MSERYSLSSVSDLSRCGWWRLTEEMPTPQRTLCSFCRVARCTGTPQRWRWVKLCCPVMPTTVGSWVLGSCSNGWTPQPAYLVSKDHQLLWHTSQKSSTSGQIVCWSYVHELTHISVVKNKKEEPLTCSCLDELISFVSVNDIVCTYHLEGHNLYCVQPRNCTTLTIHSLNDWNLLMDLGWGHVYPCVTSWF